MDQMVLKAALEWYLDHGVDEALADMPVDHTAMPVISRADPAPMQARAAAAGSAPFAPVPLLGTSDLLAQAAGLAASCTTLEELKQAIQDFDGLAVKKTATQIVFADGVPGARVMVVGEAPGADEDRQGKPFVGISGRLLDKILACINLSRAPQDGQEPVYISNILSWRPPGNRTPTDQEIQIALPFIQKHIELINPKFLILSGGVAAKGLLGAAESISRLRGTFHKIQIGDRMVHAIATYHPSYLLRTPSQKRAVWQDMLMLQERL